MVNKGDIKNAHSGLTAGGINIFAAQLSIQDFRFFVRTEDLLDDVVSRVLVSVFENSFVLDVFAVIVGVRQFVQETADDGLGFGLLGDNGGMQAVLSTSNPAVFSDKVHVVGAVHEQLGHDGIVVIILREMAIRAHFCFAFGAHGVRNVRAEGDSTQSIRGDGLLLNVDRFPVGVVGTDMNGTRGASGIDAISCDVAITRQHVDIVSKSLEVVGSVVTGYVPLVVQVGRLSICSLGEMASEAGGIPGCVAGGAAHLPVAVSTLSIVVGNVAPGEPAVFLKSHGFGDG